MSARCQFCDEELRPNSMFCANCGQLVASVPPPFGAPAAATAPTAAPASPEPEKKKRRIGRVPLPGAFGSRSPEDRDAVAGAPAGGQAQAAPPAAHPTPSPAPGARPVDPAAAPAPAGPAAVPAAPPADPRPPAALAPSTLHVKLSTGRTLAIGAPAIVGRNPGVAASDARIAAVQVDDPSRSVSRAHVRIEQAGASLAVVDLGSANGTEVERGDRTTPLVTGRAVPLAVGDRVWMGADFYFDVIGF